MILEGLVTTLNPDGSPHVAPMGPWVNPDFQHFELRPFPTSRTYQNLLAHGEGVLHVTDDALLLAKAAVGAAAPKQKVRPAEKVRGFALKSACRYFEFRITSVDSTEQRVKMQAEIVHTVTLRDFFGFNRGKHAIIEASILATRLHMLPLEEVATEYRRLRIIVEKTGGPAELEAMTFLDDYLAKVVSERAAT